MLQVTGLFLIVHCALLVSAQIIMTHGDPKLLTGDNWMIPETTPVGTIVKTVQLQGVQLEENEKIFSLSLHLPPSTENPFWVEPSNGDVYLNKTLEGMVSQRMK